MEKMKTGTCDMAQIDIKELNRLAACDPVSMIRDAEDGYHKKIRELAALAVGRRDLRVILLAGPSGAGKTTTANLLADAIKSLGEEAMVLSLDDFYRGADDPEYPKLPGGGRDFESPYALRLPDLVNTLECITAGKEFLCPKYDFKTASRKGEFIHRAMPHGCVIIEGLHALNPVISQKLPKNRILKLFVSVSTNVNNDAERIISGRKIRFVRRLVRDSIYRGADAERTLSMWRGVIIGEDRNLYPYKALADVAFDTFHAFELGVMKGRALALLDVPNLNSDPFVSVIRATLNATHSIDEILVPENSLLREFISGGIYHATYG